MFNIVDIEEETLWPSEQPRVVLDGVAFRRRVDNTEHLFKMFTYELPFQSAR